MRQEHIFIDTETSHLDCREGEIIEIACIRTNIENEVICSYTDRIRPTKPVHPEAAKVNGYNESDWANAISFETAMGSLRKNVVEGRSDKYVVIAHYAFFDKEYLETNCRETKVEYPFHKSRRWVDTYSLAQPLGEFGLVNGLHLADLCEYFNIDNIKAHSASSDVQALMQVYLKLMRRYEMLCNAEHAIRKTGTGLLDWFASLMSGDKPQFSNEE